MRFQQLHCETFDELTEGLSHFREEVYKKTIARGSGRLSPVRDEDHDG